MDSSRSTTSGGYGLGLSIVKTMVKQLGGTIKAESTKEKGSIFTFTIDIDKRRK